jgi:hypothetical protein
MSTPDQRIRLVYVRGNDPDRVERVVVLPRDYVLPVGLYGGASMSRGSSGVIPTSELVSIELVSDTEEE